MSTPPPGVSISFDPDQTVFEQDPLWIRLDNYTGINITNVQVVRGRPDERSKTNPGTVTISGMDEDGLFDPTNSSSPFYGNLDPVKQAAITLWNPNDESWNWLFRGYVSDFTLSFTTDLSKPFLDFEITFVDMLDVLNDAEIIPDSAGNMVPTESIGDSYYTGQHCDDRLFAALADTATAMYGAIWPVELLQIASGNVFVQGRAYSNQTALLQVIDETCDAEGPSATNRFITSDGAFAFRGRYYRYSPDFFIPPDGIRVEGTRMLHWNIADVQSYSVGSGMAIMSGLTFTRGKTNLINSCLMTPVGINPDQIPGKELHNAASIEKYGPRTSGMSLENLIIIKGDDGNDYIEEAQSYAEAIVENYKDPVTRVSQIKVINPYNNTDDAGQNTWDLLCNIELSDLVTIYTQHPGGGGFSGVDHFVEQITYDLQPLAGDIWQVEMTLDLTPRAYYLHIPSSWKPPMEGEITATFDWDSIGLLVTFTDTSTPGPSGPITSWAWDFGDGGTSALQNPTHTYPSVGLWAATLTITGTGSDGTSETFEGVILIDAGDTLSADFTFTQ